MLGIVEPRHLAAILSPFEHGDCDEGTPSLTDIAAQLGILSAEPILLPVDIQPDFQLALRRLLDETV